DADEQVVGHEGVQADPRLDVAAQAHVALDDHDRARALGGQGGGGQHHLVDDLLRARGAEDAGQGRLAELGQHLPYLRLEDDDDAEDQVGHERAQQPVHRLQVPELGEPVQEDEDERPQGHLYGVSAADELEELVDQEGDDQDVDDVEPGRLHSREPAAHAPDQAASPPRLASYMRSTCMMGPTPHTRTTWGRRSTRAAAAAAVPMSRSPTGRSSTRPMKLLREGPVSTGRSRAASS